MVREPKSLPPVRDPPDVATFANRRHIALRAALNVVAHDALNPLNMLMSSLYLLEVATQKAKTSPEAAAKLPKTVGDALEKQETFLRRAVAEVKVLQDVLDGQETQAAPKHVPLGSALGAVIISINAGGPVVSASGKSNQTVLARFGELELALATLMLHACHIANATQAQPMQVHTEDLADERATRITLACQSGAMPSHNRLTEAAQRHAEALSDAATCIETYQGTLTWAPSLTDGTLLVLDFPFQNTR